MDSLNLHTFVPLLQKVSERYGHGIARVLASLDGHPLHGDPDENYVRLLQLLDTELGEAKQSPKLGTNVLHDPYVIFSGHSLLGATACKRLSDLGYRIGPAAYHVMTQFGVGCYNWDHRLVPAKRYSLAFRRLSDLDNGTATPTYRTVYTWLLENGCPQDGLLAGMVPELCEAINWSDQMRDWGIDYLAVLHRPIRGRDGEPYVLGIEPNGAKLGIQAYPATDHRYVWPKKGAFAYLAELRMA